MDKISLEFIVDGKDFVACGQASEKMKKTLKQMGVPSDIVRRAAIAMYEGEVNMVIHAGGGVALVDIYPDKVELVLKDSGPGIADIEQALKEGFTTATDEIRALGFGAGLGLPNMKKYSDYMHIESELGKGTTVFMTVNIEGV